ncbi:copper chaperone CopZ [Chitinophaga skermanii]|uniref:Copper chaperone CopZ n=1 Tax=Chitinophaga skermanii TaxID=331697 RepID=A0A327QCP4_9BACT|nr:heavy-metal-associated domain-containing protein [Chitinophaga skermanii]RAJ02240.1 copper chaperone CopZ [Chitinophaga skermanii]
MRILKLLLVFLFAGTSMAMAQQAKKGIVTSKINTPTIQCESCKNRIEKYLTKEDGVKSVKVDVKKKITTVQFYPDRTNIENVKTAIANAGYDADDVTANPDSYTALPTCCKKPEDGGGMEQSKPAKKKG